MTRVSAPWLTAPETESVLRALATDAAPVYFVGGCVRNALLGRAATDLDLSTALRPDAIMARARAAGLKALPTGLDHGTVTVIAGDSAFEVTTFRRDVATDGRRAVVAFAETVEEDAARRDFTINALYATRTGQVLDPVDGLPDLAARRLRFIGDPATRLAEDHLRSLRIFRFYAQLGPAAADLDPMALAAVQAAQDGLARLSRERVSGEMAKLLATPNPGPALTAMAETGVLARVLPGAEIALIPALVAAETAAAVKPDWVRRLVALGGGDRTDDLRLSRKTAARAATLRQAVAGNTAPAEMAYRQGTAAARALALLQAAAKGTLPPSDWADTFAPAAAAVFPLTGADLLDRYAPGPDLGAALNRLETAWIASGFTLNRAMLLARDTAPSD